jgi:hypothetical protein
MLNCALEEFHENISFGLSREWSNGDPFSSHWI